MAIEVWSQICVYIVKKETELHSRICLPKVCPTITIYVLLER